MNDSDLIIGHTYTRPGAWSVRLEGIEGLLVRLLYHYDQPNELLGTLTVEGFKVLYVKDHITPTDEFMETDY